MFEVVGSWVRRRRGRKGRGVGLVVGGEGKDLVGCDCGRRNDGNGRRKRVGG